MKKKINCVLRAGGLIETNSSSSHAVSICMDEKSNLKRGDADFDLDIRNDVLYVPIRDGEFGWEYEKSNSCLTKLQYVCAFFFNSYSPLSGQKTQKILEKKLKRILGVKAVVFEWVENYVENKDQDYLECPQIDHNSYSEMKAEILENDDTLKNFILNPKSWFFGGNDNSDAPPGFYDEMYYEDPSQSDNAIVSADFPGLGMIEFPCHYPNQDYSLFYAIRNEDENGFIESLVIKDGKTLSKVHKTVPFQLPSQDTPSTDLTLLDVIIYDSKLYFCFTNGKANNHVIGATPYSEDNELVDRLRSAEDIVEGVDYLLIPGKLWTEKFGYIYE